MINPAFFLDSRSLRSSDTFSWKVFPEYLSGCTRTFSLGRAGRSLPQTKSIKFSWTPTRVDPFFSRVSASFRAPAIEVQHHYPHSRPQAAKLTRCDQRGIDTNGLASLGLLCGPIERFSFQHISPCIIVCSYHSCHVGTPSTPRFRSCQLLSNCFAAWLKYRPSVERAALLREMIAVPAEPENTEINSAQGISCGRRRTEGGRLRTSTGITRRNVLGLVAIF
jgi:hypothetical protein